MDSALQPVTHRPTTNEPLRVVPIAQTLNVAAMYTLSETGRKTSVLAGGDGKAVQRLTLPVPAAPAFGLGRFERRGAPQARAAL